MCIIIIIYLKISALEYSMVQHPATEEMWILLISSKIIMNLAYQVEIFFTFCWYVGNNHAFAWSTTRNYSFWKSYIVLGFYLSSGKIFAFFINHIMYHQLSSIMSCIFNFHQSYHVSWNFSSIMIMHFYNWPKKCILLRICKYCM